MIFEHFKHENSRTLQAKNVKKNWFFFFTKLLSFNQKFEIMGPAKSSELNQKKYFDKQNGW